MLRRRRRSLPGGDGMAERQWSNGVRKQITKLKMSPFPEVKGIPLKDKNNQLNQLSEVKASIQFTDSQPPVDQSTTTTPANQDSKDKRDISTLDSKSAVIDMSSTNSRVELGQLPLAENVVPDSVDREVNLRSCQSNQRMERNEERTLKPSTVQKLESQMSPRQPKKSASHPNGSHTGSLSTVWDSVVSWMRQAVDFVTVEADPVSSRHQLGKRARPDYSQTDPSSKQPKLTNQRAAANGRGVAKQSRRSKRLSFGGLQSKPPQGLPDLLSHQSLPSISESSVQQKPPVTHDSPTTLLTSQLSHNLTVKSPPVDTIVNPTLFKFAAQKYHSTNHGLNSILDGSPVALVGRKKAPQIRRQSLSQYYGRSVDSPNLSEVPQEMVTVRRSPRLAEKATPPKVPPPPPPPPPPPLPLHSLRAPPTPRIPAMYDCDLHGNATPSRGGVDQSRAMLQKMQSRLRTRMKKKTVNGADVKGRTVNPPSVDIKTQQWAEIQALSRKMSVAEFLALTETKKLQIKMALEELQLNVPETTAGISERVELLHEGSQWFSGGVKEMRDCLPLYKNLERKIEALNEFTHLSDQIRVASVSELPEGIHYSELHTSLSHIRNDFDSKHRQWGPVVLSNAQSWQELGLPVCGQLLLKARQYVCELVGSFVKCTLMEANKMEGVLLSLKCVRTKQVMDRLRESIQLLTDSQSYFKSPSIASCSGCDQCASTTASNHDNMSALLKHILDVALSFVNIALGQFEGFVGKSKRQEVCEHFESVLKVINMVKVLVCDLHGTKPSRVKTTGVICLLPEGELLSNAIYGSCVSLIQHILSQTSNCSCECSPRSQERQSKEVILWMMFGCKYVHQTLEVLGSDKANARGVAELLSQLQQMENLLPN